MCIMVVKWLHDGSVQADSEAFLFSRRARFSGLTLGFEAGDRAFVAAARLAVEAIEVD